MEEEMTHGLRDALYEKPEYAEGGPEWFLLQQIGLFYYGSGMMEMRP